MSKWWLEKKFNQFTKILVKPQISDIFYTNGDFVWFK
jgi:hypothetical protein